MLSLCEPSELERLAANLSRYLPWRYRKKIPTRGFKFSIGDIDEYEVYVGNQSKVKRWSFKLNSNGGVIKSHVTSYTIDEKLILPDADSFYRRAYDDMIASKNGENTFRYFITEMDRVYKFLSGESEKILKEANYTVAFLSVVGSVIFIAYNDFLQKAGNSDKASHIAIGIGLVYGASIIGLYVSLREKMSHLGEQVRKDMLNDAIISPYLNHSPQTIKK